MDFRADLHCHTTCSDGTDNPKELLDFAKQAGLSGLSITDHDTLDAYTPKVFEHAQNLGLRLGTGIELSSRHLDQSVHILGFGFDPKSEVLVDFCKQHQARRYERNRAMCIKLEKMGMPIGDGWLLDEAGIPKKGIGRPHLAMRMIERGYVTDVREAFSRYLAEGKPAFVLSAFFGALETINKIHAAGGKAFIAHPHLIKHKKLVKALLAMPFDGIECYYGNFHGSQEKIWIDRAHEKGWMISGGSDYHGSIKPETQLGASYVSEEVFNHIFNSV